MQVGRSIKRLSFALLNHCLPAYSLWRVVSRIGDQLARRPGLNSDLSSGPAVPSTACMPVAVPQMADSGGGRLKLVYGPGSPPALPATSVVDLVAQMLEHEYIDLTIISAKLTAALN